METAEAAIRASPRITFFDLMSVVSEVKYRDDYSLTMTGKTTKVDDRTGSDDNKQRSSDADDAIERQYYYDDSHGYKEFDPDDDEEAEEGTEPSSSRS